MNSPGANMSDEWHIALVDFIRSSDDSDVLGVLDDEIHGAVGWLGVLTKHATEIENIVRENFSSIGLHVVSITDCQQVNSVSEVEEIDEHLAQNIRTQPLDDPVVVWGTIHTYYAEGEA